MATLAQNLVAIELAQDLYHARRRYYGIDAPAWESLDPIVKQHYVEHAQDALDAVQPAPGARVHTEWPAGSARHVAARVIGSIPPLPSHGAPEP